jgi:hypothetical protein
LDSQVSVAMCPNGIGERGKERRHQLKKRR